MLKLVINDYKFYNLDNTNQDSMVCRIKSSLIDTTTNHVLSEFNQSSRVVREEDDDPDEDLARNLSFSRAKIKSYRAAKHFIQNNLDPNNLMTIIGICYMERFEEVERCHENFLLGIDEECSTTDLVIEVLFKVLDVLPKLRNEGYNTRFDIRDALYDVKSELDF